MILAKTINKTRSVALAVSAAAVTIAAPAALVSAHGFSGGHPDFGWDHQSNQSQVQTASYTHGQGQSDPNQGSNNQNNIRLADFRKRFQQTCDQKQTELNSQAAAIKASDQKKLNGQNILYSGVQNYVTSNNVTVTNYDTMSAQVTADQTTATNAVNAITAPNLNCANTTPNSNNSDTSGDMTTMNGNMNSQLKAFEQEENTANQALATYRHDLATLFNAVLNS